MCKTLEYMALLTQISVSSFLNPLQCAFEDKDFVEQVVQDRSISQQMFADAEAYIASFEPFSMQVCDEFENFIRAKKINKFLRINYEKGIGFSASIHADNKHLWVQRFQKGFIPYLNLSGFDHDKNFSFFVPLEDLASFPEIELFLGKIPLCCPDRPYQDVSKWIIIPDHYVQQNTYRDLIVSINNEKRKYPFFEREDRLGFRGSQTGPNSVHYDMDSFGHIPRLDLVMLSHTHPDYVDARFTDYDCQLKKTEKGRQYKEFMIETFGLPVQFMPFEQMTKYRYNASLDGNIGAWQRPHLVMFTGSVPIFQYEYHNYFTPYLKENIHYVAIKPDMSDVIEKIDMLRADPALTKSIIQNASDFAEEVLTPEFIKTYMRFLLERIAAQFCDDFTESEFLKSDAIEKLHFEPNVDVESLGIQIFLGERDDLIYPNLWWHYRIGVRHFEILHQGLSESQDKRIKMFYDCVIDVCSLNLIPMQQGSTFVSTLPRSLKSIIQITDRQAFVYAETN